jgi:hypothetical protein
MRRIILFLAVAALLATMIVVMATPAFAKKAMIQADRTSLLVILLLGKSGTAVGAMAVVDS